MAALKTPNMKLAIANAFENDGLFKLIRSEEQQAIAGAAILEATIAESRLTLPFTFGDLRRQINEALAAVDNEAEESDQERGDEEIVGDDSDNDEDD
jgi:hypothetical protein